MAEIWVKPTDHFRVRPRYSFAARLVFWRRRQYRWLREHELHRYPDRRATHPNARLYRFARIHAQFLVEGSVDEPALHSPEHFRIWERISMNGTT